MSGYELVTDEYEGPKMESLPDDVRTEVQRVLSQLPKGAKLQVDTTNGAGDHIVHGKRLADFQAGFVTDDRGLVSVVLYGPDASHDLRIIGHLPSGERERIMNYKPDELEVLVTPNQMEEYTRPFKYRGKLEGQRRK